MVLLLLWSLEFGVISNTTFYISHSVLMSMYTPVCIIHIRIYIPIIFAAFSCLLFHLRIPSVGIFTPTSGPLEGIFMPIKQLLDNLGQHNFAYKLN